VRVSEMLDLEWNAMLAAHQGVRAGTKTRKHVRRFMPERIKNFADAAAAISILAIKKGERSMLFGQVIERSCEVCSTPAEFASANSVLICERLPDLEKSLSDRAVSELPSNGLMELLDLLPECTLAEEIRFSLSEGIAS
jgi:hypothetical protein